MKTRIRNGVLSFVVPLFLVGILIGALYGQHQYKDINEIHPGQFLNYSESDAIRSSWEAAIQSGLLAGVPAGAIGLLGYLCYRFAESKRSSEK